MTGTKTVQKAAFTYSGSRGAPMLNHVNESVEQIQRPLLTTDEVLRLLPPEKEGEGEYEKIVAPGDMLIFVSGRPPIYGKQMLYFLDDILRTRSEMPPPNRLLSVNSPIPPTSHGSTSGDQHHDALAGGRQDQEHLHVLKNAPPTQLSLRLAPTERSVER